MKLFNKKLVRALGVACITLASGMALAESNRWVCQGFGNVGATASEPLGDREGHAIESSLQKPHKSDGVTVCS